MLLDRAESFRARSTIGHWNSASILSSAIVNGVSIIGNVSEHADEADAERDRKADREDVHLLRDARDDARGPGW